MPDFSLVGGGTEVIESGFVLASTRGTLITAAGSTNTKGGFTELLSAANNTESSGAIEVVIGTDGASQAGFLIDIALGGAGSEEVIFSNLRGFITNTGHNSVLRYPFPYSISSGVRISARSQSTTASAPVPVYITRAPGSFIGQVGLGEVTTYGADTSDSGGITVARSSTVGTYGSFVEIIASTTRPIKGFIVAGIHQRVSSWTTSDLNYEVAVGGSGLEAVIIEGQLMGLSNNEMGCGFISSFHSVSVAEGQRLSIHAAGSVDNPDLDLDYTIYGVS